MKTLRDISAQTFTGAYENPAALRPGFHSRHHRPCSRPASCSNRCATRSSTSRDISVRDEVGSRCLREQFRSMKCASSTSISCSPSTDSGAHRICHLYPLGRLRVHRTVDACMDDKNRLQTPAKLALPVLALAFGAITIGRLSTPDGLAFLGFMLCMLLFLNNRWESMVVAVALIESVPISCSSQDRSFCTACSSAGSGEPRQSRPS